MIGDVLTSTILFEAIKEKHPHFQLHYLINSHTEAVVLNNPFIDKILYFSPEFEQSKRAFSKLVRFINNCNYDAIIDVYGKLSSLTILGLSGADLKIGYSKSYSNWIYTHPIRRTKSPEHGVSLALENRMKLLEPLDIPFSPIQPKLFVTKEEKTQAELFLKQGGLDIYKPIIMVSALGSSESKTYPTNYMAELLEKTIEIAPDVQFLFNYLPSQKENALELYENCNPQTKANIFIDLYSDSLRNFITILTQCNAIIGNEGGAINIAKALNVPSFIIFSPHIGKKNWFADIETGPHVAIHIEDYIDPTAFDKKKSKKEFAVYYEKLKPSLFIHKLQTFVKSI